MQRGLPLHQWWPAQLHPVSTISLLGSLDLPILACLGEERQRLYSTLCTIHLCFKHKQGQAACNLNISPLLNRRQCGKLRCIIMALTCSRCQRFFSSSAFSAASGLSVFASIALYRSLSRSAASSKSTPRSTPRSSTCIQRHEQPLQGQHCHG